MTDALKGSSLPSVSSNDNGKVLKVVNGAWAVKYSGGDTETLSGYVTVTHSFTSRKSYMSITGVPFQPTHPWSKCVASIALIGEGTNGSYDVYSYGEKTPGNNLLIVGGYCRPGQNTSWTYEEWYLNLDSTGSTLSWVVASSGTGDNHGDSGSYQWTFSLQVIGTFA